jgi:putative FmdB family regulatory protein
MPTYEYECTSCGYKFESFQKITDQPLASCPKCDKPLRRLISSGVGIIFKGSGFYATDYRKKPAKDKGAKAEKSCPQPKSPGCQGCPKLDS